MFDNGTSIWDTLDFGSPEFVEVEELRAGILADEAEISAIRARQIARLRRLDVLQVDTADGARTMADWVTANLDISPQTAGRLVRIARSQQPDIEERLVLGEYGVDRAAFLCRLRELGAPEEVIVNSSDYSLGHLYGLIDRLRRVDELSEELSFEDRYLVLQPSLDESAYRIWGQLPGVDGRIVEKALNNRETELPVLPDQRSGQRRADALTSICMDSLTSSAEDGKGRAVTVAEVFVDASLAAPTFGEAGVTLSSGPRVGPNALDEILCTGKIRVIVEDADLRPIGVSDLGEAIPPAVRAAVLHRDQGQCQIDGCRSKYRLQPHHIRPRSRGGDHDPVNLVTLCWYHHHVAIHMLGMILEPGSPPHRRRLIRLPNHDPPQTTHRSVTAFATLN
ncbi:MAG TPA: HNH endonuclease [Acidimicrobiia bacterium]